MKYERELIERNYHFFSLWRIQKESMKQSRTPTLWPLLFQVLLDATKPQDGVNGNAEGVHSAEGGDSGRATGSEVEFVSLHSALSHLISHFPFRSSSFYPFAHFNTIFTYFHGGNAKLYLAVWAHGFTLLLGLSIIIFRFHIGSRSSQTEIWSLKWFTTLFS